MEQLLNELKFNFSTRNFEKTDLSSLSQAGLGRFIARALALNGAAKVFILGRTQSSLDDCEASVSTKNIIPVRCDITSLEYVSAAVSRISNEAGQKINLLVCNAAIEGPTTQVLPQTGASIAEFAKSLVAVSLVNQAECFRTNVAAIWSLIASFLEMLDAGNKAQDVGWSSQVINLASVAGFMRVSPGAFTYAQSKAAVTHMTKQLASTLVPYNIRANAIAPGSKSPLTRSIAILVDFISRPTLNNMLVCPEEMTNHWVEKKIILPEEYPGGRFGDELDMAGAILFLASRAGGYINGEILLADGGKLGTVPCVVSDSLDNRDLKVKSLEIQNCMHLTN
ncbi:hypothetical protein LTR84_008266 [Exophiala bonariae]|uniref:NAD(P)-binding protein n=1 Tax=Exophiala bonariae TaxID=1690606 RepID=A0AAV9MY13_9EURO|nr:hypothetical protein LTR84_008266 [Exophiala bonariae]